MLIPYVEVCHPGSMGPASSSADRALTATVSQCQPASLRQPASANVSQCPYMKPGQPVTANVSQLSSVSQCQLMSATFSPSASLPMSANVSHFQPSASLPMSANVPMLSHVSQCPYVKSASVRGLAASGALTARTAPDRLNILHGILQFVV